MRSNKELCGEIDIFIREPGTSECWDDEYSVVLDNIVEYDEDQVLQIHDELGTLVQKIQQRRAEKARSNENRKNND
jgi:hypothetical protein